MNESLGERIHRMQVENRDITVEQIAEATGLGELSVWPYYAGFAFVEIERLRAENAQLRESGAMLIKTVDRLRDHHDEELHGWCGDRPGTEEDDAA